MEVIVTSWKPGVRSIDLIQLIREVRGTGLAETKAEVDRFIAGSQADIRLVVSRDESVDILKRLEGVGVNFTVS